MEEDDEFGDLYTDVLTTFPSSSSSMSHPPPPPPPTEESPSIPIHHLHSHPPSLPLHSNFNPSHSDSKISPPPDPTPIRVFHTPPFNSSLHPDSIQLDVLGPPKDADFDTLDHNFDTADQINPSMEDMGSEPIIPGLASNPLSKPVSDEGDDWDSDSDDDLQIVLNDNNHGPIGMDTNGLMVASNDDDEDEEPLVIVADNDVAHQPADDQDWGDDQGQATDGKEMLDSSKPNGGLVTAPKTAYSNYAYHPFHSQFKYVRPGAGPLPGGPPAGSGGAIHIRPPVSTNNAVGRGRGDWRLPGMKGPSSQKGFHPGFWGVQGRGLEFTLPSHKTVFDVDIDSFEEKPWKYPGVDVSDFFNFGLNEDSWKDYCKQLEQLRLESTMQSKIRVYEIGRAEQEYDPDLPPELAAATGIHDTSTENAICSKVQGEVGGEPAKLSERVRPPLPTGRAIQVETGCGERLPSVDTRPPRVRDSDAVIEIVLQDSMDEAYAGNDALEYPANDSPREDDRVDVDGDGPQDGDGYFEGYSQGFRHMDEEIAGERSAVMNSLHAEERDKSLPQRGSNDNLGSGGHAPKEDAGSPTEKWTTGKLCERSPHMSSGDSALDRRSHDHHQEDSIDSTEGKHSLESFDPAAEDTQLSSLEGPLAPENVPADRKAATVKEDINVVSSDNTSKDKARLPSSKQQKLSSRVEPMGSKEVDEVSDLKAPRSSNISRSMGSSKDHSKWHEGAEEEIVKDGRSANVDDLKKNRAETGHDSRRHDHNGRAKLERNYSLTKGREEYHSHRDSSAANHFHLKGDSTDWRKERDLSEFNWQKRDDEPHGRRIRVEDARKQEHADVIVSGDRAKVREFDRSDKESSRKPLDDGSWRVYHEKDARLRYRDKDDNLKSRHDISDDRHIKRRKDDEHLRRDQMEKEEITLGCGESSSTRRKRDRDDISIQGKKDDQPRIRDNMDDHSSGRFKEEFWMQREKAEQQRERDEWYRTKQPYEEHLSRREREDGRVSNRYSRSVDEKKWTGHSHGREEYSSHDKDTGRHGEQLTRRDRVEDETGLQYRGKDDAYQRGKQFGNEVKRSRQEKSGTRNDRAVHASVSTRVHEKNKDITKSSREPQGHGSSAKRDRGEKGGVNETADLKGTSEKAEAKHDPGNNLARERRDISSDEEQPDSKRGRSKLERWTSHKERDYDINSKSSSSLKIKDISRDKAAGSVSGSSTGAEEESGRRADTMDNSQPLVGGNEGGGSDSRDADVKHLDTFEKLKRRSERFKVPLTSEKDAISIKKTESEASPSSQNDAPGNSLVKPERPARKRRWISS